jgi:hypothetical protein
MKNSAMKNLRRLSGNGNPYPPGSRLAWAYDNLDAAEEAVKHRRRMCVLFGSGDEETYVFAVTRAAVAAKVIPLGAPALRRRGPQRLVARQLNRRRCSRNGGTWKTLFIVSHDRTPP